MVEPQRDRSDDRAIPDLTAIPLDEIFSAVDDSALGRALRRVKDEMQEKREQYAAHSSSA
jgi:FXSXX-COOH protein